MPIRLPFKRICPKHFTEIQSNRVGEREIISCDEGHNCNRWLVTDSESNWVGVGHKDKSGEIFPVVKPLPRGGSNSPPYRPCKYGHMDWTVFKDKKAGKKRYRCRACQTKVFRELKKKGLV